MLAAAFAAIAVVIAILVIYGSVAASKRLGEPRELRRRLAVRMTIATATWLALTGAAAKSGILARTDFRPPPIAGVFVATLLLVIVFSRSSAGTRLVRGLPLAVLVGVQLFRLPLELAMHAAAREGLLPEQLTFTGTNFDIVTGILAIPVAILVMRDHPWSRRLAWIWNVLGIALLANVVITAMLSLPLIHAFGTDPAHVNTFILHFPFVWLVTVCVAAAAAGHALVLRSLLATRERAARP